MRFLARNTRREPSLRELMVSSLEEPRTLRLIQGGRFSEHLGPKQESFLDRNPRVKGFLQSSFAGAAIMGTAKLGFSTAVKALDWGGAGTALTTGTWSAVAEARKDYLKARELFFENGEQISRRAALNSIWHEHKKKYGMKFVKGAGIGFAGAWGADVVIDNWDAIKDFTAPVREYTKPFTAWLGETFKPVGDFFKSIPEKFSSLKESFSGLGEKFTRAKNSVMNFFSNFGKPSAPQGPTASGRIKEAHEAFATATPQGRIAEAHEAFASPTPADVLKVPEPVTNLTIEPAAPAAPLEAVVPVPPSPTEQLQKLVESGTLKPKAQAALTEALKGKSWAMNQVIDGMINNRFGFSQNKELAAELTKMLAAKGDSEGMLKLAYMQYHGTFAGVEANRDAALATIKKLGRSWVGGEALIDTANNTATRVAETVTAPLPAAPAMPSIPRVEIPQIDVAKMNEALSCTATEKAPGLSPKFDTVCTPGAAKFEPGRTIGLNVKFNTGLNRVLDINIGAKAANMSAAEYLEQVMPNALNRAQATAAANPELIVAR
jgi:hypothetical protein